MEKSRTEIERLLRHHGATGFATSWDRDRFMVLFELRSRRVRFDIPAPSAKEYPEGKWEAENRRRWRALLLILKAKLELVASGDTDFEAEFLANLVLANGSTLGAHLLPTLSDVLDSSKMPNLLGPVR